MTSANPVDPNSIRLTGENSFIRLVEDGEQTTRTSHWRVLYSPGGAGHVLFIKSDLVDVAFASTPTTSPSPAGFRKKSRACFSPSSPTSPSRS